MSGTGNFSGLIAIAELAIAVNNRETVVKHRKIALNEAYNAFKDINGIDHVERDSDEWESMMFSTKKEYAVLEAAKREEKNARRRLSTAIRRYRNGEVA